MPIAYTGGTLPHVQAGVLAVIGLAAVQKRKPSTTSLDPPGAEMGNLVGRDEPQHHILEEPPGAGRVPAPCG
jgi:hypothetical protein